MKQFFSSALLIIMIYLCNACHTPPKDKSMEVPESGELCFKADSSSEYLQFVIDHGKVKGRLLNTKEDEILVKSFSGELVPESSRSTYRSIEVTVSYADASDDKTWVIWLQKDGVNIKFDDEYLHYTKISNDEFSKLYNSLNETILTYKSTGFIVPKGEPLCYQSVSANANKRTTVREFFQLWNKDGKLKGRGAGYDEGGTIWDFDLHGTLEGTEMKVTVNYRAKGEAQHTVSETWRIDPKENRIYIKEYPRTVLSSNEYVNTGNEGFLNFVHSYFEKEDLVR
jgi:hypothetical protein